ncbi:3'-5' exonuclease [uncultured Porphyromonas sp.]|uniref:3'-5' exonuclease n=1 Tax=uncultured Porphyromonas sp. TaxID=159274 RepID=UPI002805DB0D|nr:3'-5' exonuclease [uncultured Porphyromonas sp.]
MAWLVPENKLDDQQRDFVENVDINQRNVWIKGFPGSGKSVLLAYTMKRIKRKDPQASVAVVVFTHSLISMFKAAFEEMGVSANIMTYYQFMAGSSRYDYVLSDEVQDMTSRVLSTMTSRAKHVIVAGDENQSIYESDPKFREPTVTPSQISDLLNCRSFELGIIHRLSSSIITAVEKFMPGMNIFSSRRDLTKKTTQIRLCTAHSEEEEVEYIMREAQRAVNVGDTAAILIPSQQKILTFFQMALSAMGKSQWTVQLNQWGKVNYNKLNQYLRSNGIKLQYVGNGYGSLSDDDNCICVMTYHSSKGLDFDNVFLPFLSQSLYINSNESLSRTLFMVAMTRSRNNLYLTHSGSKSAYLSNFASDCSEINVHNVLNGQTGSSGEGNIFGI